MPGTNLPPIKKPLVNSLAGPVPLLDVVRDSLPLRDQILAAIARIYDAGCFVNGPDCKEFEAAMAGICQTDFAIGCASGSDALLLALMACDIGSGDEVIVPSFTFFATASAVWRLGAVPIFADIDPATFNIDPAAIEAAITDKTKAVIPVHLFGQCAAMDEINRIAKRNSLLVIEDVAQAIGATYGDRVAGSIGDVGCFSFYPTKNLGGLGDGGLLTTSSAELAARLRLLASHGMQPRYYHQEVGINSRLDTIQAAALNIKLPCLGDWTIQRRESAKRYDDLFQSTGLNQRIIVPTAASNCGHVWNQYTIRVPQARREDLRRHLSSAKIGSEVYYPVPLHRQQCFESLRQAHGHFPETDQAAAEVLSLPIFPGLTLAEQETVVHAIAKFYDALERQTAAPQRLAS